MVFDPVMAVPVEVAPPVSDVAGADDAAVEPGFGVAVLPPDAVALGDVFAVVCDVGVAVLEAAADDRGVGVAELDGVGVLELLVGVGENEPEKKGVGVPGLDVN